MGNSPKPQQDRQFVESAGFCAEHFLPAAGQSPRPHDAVAALLTLYDDNAADQTATGQRREWHLAREWRDRMYRPEQVAARQAAIRERGRNQLT